MARFSHKWFKQVQDLVAYVNTYEIKAKDIVYLDKAESGGWNLMFYHDAKNGTQ